jgi:tetratricopeptide (TPR) repeat protein
LNLRRSLLLAVLSTLVFLALIEGAARVAVRVHPPARAPGAEPEAPAPPSPAPNAFRIFLYGGSTVAGVPLVEYSFARQLAFWLERLAPQRDWQLVEYGALGRPTAYALLELQRTIDAHPDLVIVHSLHNEFMGWRPPGPGKRLRRELRRWLDTTATARVLRGWLGELERTRRASRDELMLPERIAPLDRAGPAFAERIAEFERATRAIAELARARGVPLILLTDSGNLADWPPVWRFVRDERYEQSVEAVRADFAHGELGAAEAGIAALSARYPGDAMATWLAGRLALARGDAAAARASFDAARDADPVAWRVLSRFDDYVRSLGRGGEALVADADAAFRREARDGLVGFEWVADNCHPTPLGNALIARELLAAMAEARLGIDSLDGLPPLAEQADVFVREARRARPDAELSYLLANGRYTMKWPFYAFDTATAYFERARAIAPDDWSVWANLGTVAVLAGRVEQGRAQIERAAALHGGPLDPGDRGATPYLREALAILSGELARYAPAERLERR